ncbi:MAG: hypothetical protein K6U89_02710 [Chloroflexi bacterium]|nr:hypothetical protein [Chloroflexota bacterium]
MTGGERWDRSPSWTQRWQRLVLATVLTLLLILTGLWLLLARVELNESPGSTVGAVPASARPSFTFVGVAAGLHWVDLRVLSTSSGAILQVRLVEAQPPGRVVADWTVPVERPGPLWLQLAPLAGSRGVAYRVEVEPGGEGEVLLRLAPGPSGEPVLAVQRFYRTTLLEWLQVMAARLLTPERAAPALSAAALGLGAFAALLAALIWRTGLLPRLGWLAVGVLMLGWLVILLQSAAAADLWAQVNARWPDGP